ncbi:S1/P1 nuclease [Sphingomonas aestuarii]
MIRRLLLAAAAAVTFALPAPALAYWEFGHEAVATIARLNVKPETRAKIFALLRQQSLLNTPTCPAGTMEAASVWADCVKPLGQRFSYANNWHYQNVHVCKPFDIKSNCPDGNCVSAQIDRMTALLQDKAVPEAEKVQALVFLIHLVGDLHMPLHAGDRGDLGGNRVPAAYGLWAPERFNLHSLWDGYLAERAITTPPEIRRAYSAEERDALWGGTVEDWSRESWQASRDVAYATAMGGDPCAQIEGRAVHDDAMIARIVPTARDQVMKGGLRLARRLDEAFDPAKAFDSRERRRR